jgi:hypothetical protein
MNRFRPTVEALSARTVPSAVFAEPCDATAPATTAVSEIVVTKDQGCSSTSLLPVREIVVTKDQDDTTTSLLAVSEIVVTKNQDCSSTG